MSARGRRGVRIESMMHELDESVGAAITTSAAYPLDRAGLAV